MPSDRQSNDVSVGAPGVPYHSANITQSDPFIHGNTKGLPEVGAGIHLSEIGPRRWNLLNESIPLPVAVLRGSAIANNSRWMRNFLAQSNTKLAPHGKTTMSPQLFARQMIDGAWGLTLATVQQMRVARSTGINRIILANELIGRQDIAYVLAELTADPTLELYCFVDSIEGVRRFTDAAVSGSAQEPIRLLLEVGPWGGRAGCRDVAASLEVAAAIRASGPRLALYGLAGYEGLFQTLPRAEAVPKVEEFLHFLVTVARRIDQEMLFDSSTVILSAGGSAYYDLTADILSEAKLSRPSTTILRCGCYLTHDSGLYQRLFSDIRHRSDSAKQVPDTCENALEVWAYVQSTPESGRAILSAGRRDFGHDAGPPTPLKCFTPGRDSEPRAINGRASIVSINDQHAHLVYSPDLRLSIGDMVGLGVSHPCTTFDRWQLLYVVDDEYTIRSAIQTHF